MKDPLCRLSLLAGAEIQKTNKEELVDVRGMPLDPQIPHELRAGYLFQSVKNPYCFRVGDLGVKLEFMDDSPSLQDILLNFLLRKKRGL